MDKKQKYMMMAKYDRNLAQLHHIAYEQLAGHWTAPQLIKILLQRGEQPISEGGWVPAHRNTMLKMMKRAQAIATKVAQKRTE